ncbi:hypothetical protein ASPCAL12868 [Aspergillus calidoustus]|uniref:Uncharacterized protein n=1 Tax=Aspergillus calidoustus TaxID=454130 RepID=A0A0U5CGN0_ASPCI|nr:hypothetical protein ASPCAL12868 [Aspergillus calidoustus]
MIDPDGVACTILYHLIVNTLAELPDGHLYSRLFDYEDDDQANNWVCLIDKLCGIVKIMIEIPNSKSLKLSWLDPRKQQILREVSSAGLISREYISGFVKATWDQIIGERHFGERMEYEVPPVLINVGMQLPDPDMLKPGLHHLGLLHPYEELILMHHGLLYTAHDAHSSERNPRWHFQKEKKHLVVEPLQPKRLDIVTKIYPQPKLFEPGEDDSWKVFPEIRIPNFGNVMSQLAANLVNHSYPQLRRMPYRQVITAWGGASKIAKRLCGYIDRDVLLLEGQKLSVELLNKVAVKQSERGKLWLPSSGYVDYVTDDRDSRYIRMYIGQAKVSDRRLMQHINDATRSVPQSLHIFIIHQGNGQRAMNFLKLWTIHDLNSMDDESAMILPNILEMAMCASFQSLPPQVFETFFAPLTSPNQQYAGVGLNVLCPLYQGMRSVLKVRQETITYLESSLDPQIAMYPTFRAQRRGPISTLERWKGDMKIETWKEHIHLFCSAVGFAGNGDDVFEAPATPTTEQLISGHQVAKKTLSTAIAEITGEDLHEGFPVGDVAAKIGIVITRCVVSMEEESVLWGIRETGFTNKNCLLWLADPRWRKLTQSCQALCPMASKKLIQFHRHIIENSGLRVIIVDLEASQHVIPGIPLDKRKEFQLQWYCGNISGFAEKDDQGRLQRVYLQSPRSLTSLLSCSGPATQTISEMFKLTAAMTRTHGIRPYYCASSSAVHQILKIYGEEQDGAPRITTTDIPVTIQAFLYRKGFRRPEDIQRLVDIGGYLSRGLLLLLVILRRQPHNFSGLRNLQTAGSKKKAHRRGIFSSDEMKKVDSLLPAALKLPPMSGESQPSVKALAHVAVECLASLDGRVDNHELKNMIQLADEKEQELRESLEDDKNEGLDLEVNDIGVDTPCSELFPEMDDDIDDLEPTRDNSIFQSSRWPHSSAPRRRPEWHRNRQKDRRILYGGVKYRGAWQPDKGGLVLHVLPDLAHILITLKGKERRDDFASEILVRAEIHPAKKHPNCWALDAMDTDPGAKLALIVDDGDGERFINTEGEGNARKANTFVDWFSGCSLETIASRPRRHIDTGSGDTVVKALKLNASGTYYTDEHGQLSKSPHVSRVPAS